jgi:hypothetical protein
LKTIKIAVWINVFLYVTLLCFAAWIFFKIAVVVAPRFPEAPMSGKLFVISHFFPLLLFYTLPVLSIIGLLRRRNWGRILTIFTNIFLSVGYLAGRIIGAMGGLHITQALITRDVLIAYLVASPLIVFAVIFLTRKAKLYFVGTYKLDGVKV